MKQQQQQKNVNEFCAMFSHLHICTNFAIQLFQENIELIIQIRRHRNIRKHSMQFVGKLIAACLLQTEQLKLNTKI